MEAQLGRDLRAVPMPAAPDRLRERVRTIIAVEPGPAEAGPAPVQRGRTRTRFLLAVAAVLVGATAVLVATGSKRPVVSVVDSLPVMSVSEALAAHAAGTLPGGRAAIRGWWSNGSLPHSCAPGTGTIGELELYCHDGEFGITERNEPIYVVNLETFEVTYEAQGPHVTPYIDSGTPGVDALFDVQIINGQWLPPVPIVVVGHFDDPRAAQCNDARRQLCLDRLVLERVVEYDLRSVATPGVTPTPTPFPDPAPSGVFDAAQCAGDVSYSFVGWTTTSELHMEYDRPGHVFAMVTADAVRLTDEEWVDDPNGSGHQFQIWGRKVCISKDGDTMEYSAVVGSTYVLWDDGLRVEGSNPVRS